MKSGLKQNIKLAGMLLYFFGLTVAAGLKYYYSNASADDLLWILYPTAVSVEHMTGLHFIREAQSGFINYSKEICIAPACSGVNFLIISFCMVFFSFVRQIHSQGLRWLWLVISLSGSYILTVIVNSVRIVISIFLIDNNIHYGWLTSARIHRLEGVVLYFLFLSIFYIVIKRIIVLRNRSDKEGNIRDVVCGSHKVSEAAVPLFWYLFVTLTIPLVNGSYQQQGMLFIEHSLMVLFSCLSIFLLIHWMRLYSKMILIKIGISMKNYSGKITAEEQYK